MLISVQFLKEFQMILHHLVKIMQLSNSTKEKAKIKMLI
jgi:hypothetical protein